MPAKKKTSVNPKPPSPSPEAASAPVEPPQPDTLATLRSLERVAVAAVEEARALSRVPPGLSPEQENVLRLHAANRVATTMVKVGEYSGYLAALKDLGAIDAETLTSSMQVLEHLIPTLRRPS